jgi:hypothetical protein
MRLRIKKNKEGGLQMAKHNVKVDIFVGKPDDTTKLSDAVIVKHETDVAGTGSVLTQLGIMDDMKVKNTSIKEKRLQAAALHRQAEALNQQADIMLGIEQGQTSFTEGTLYNYLTQVRDLLLVLNKGKEEQLGYWGFNVVVGADSEHSES